MENTPEENQANTPEQEQTPVVSKKINMSVNDFFSKKKDDMSEKGKNVNDIFKNHKFAFLLKNVSIAFCVLTIFSFLWFTVDLDPENKYLSSVYIENVGSQFESQNQKKFLLDTNLITIVSKIEKLEDKIENKKFLEYQEEIDDIRSDQLIWFDRESEDGYLFGMIDVFDSIQNFFNDRRYTDPEKIVSGRRDQVQIEEVSVDRNGARISVRVSEILGRVFFLTNEFVDVINSIPFYSGTNIKSFSREKNELGDDTMKFSLNLKRQINPNKDSQTPAPEIDPADERFNEFLDWFRSLK